MSAHDWCEDDHAHLLQKTNLLQLLNEIPEKPHENKILNSNSREGGSSGRSLTLQREKELAESFAFLAATTDDPKRIVAACVEEHAVKGGMTVRLAINNGGLDVVKTRFEKMSKILKRATQSGKPEISCRQFSSKMENKEQNRADEELHALLCEVVALNQKRMLIRLRSRHATSRSNFKKKKSQRAKLIPQLHNLTDSLDGTRGILPPAFLALKADIHELGRLFECLEHLSALEAKSRPGLEILVDLVTTCHHVHNQRILNQMLTEVPQLETNARESTVRTITKLGRYSAVSQFLLQIARRNSIFNNVLISIVCFKAQKLAATELDPITKDFVHTLWNKSRVEKLTSKYHNASASAIEDYIRQEATMAVPVHAEIQLLLYYEWNPSSLPPRIICSSKQACFLCNLFFKIHGKFIVPSTHGRLYEKWTLPPDIKIIRKGGNILTTCRSFVSNIENAILLELQSSRKPYPAPYESMILNSAASSHLNSSQISARDSFASQRPGLHDRSVSASSIETLSPRRSHVIPTGEAAMETVTAGGSRTDAHSSQSETSSAVTVCAPLSPTASRQSIDRLEGNASSSTSHVPLAKCRPVCCEISATNPSFEVRTPCVHLTITRDETIRNELGPDLDHYWVILEYLSDHSIQDGQEFPVVDLSSVPTGRDMTLDYGSSETLRKLLVYSKDDVISVTYSLHKPVDGLEYRA